MIALTPAEWAGGLTFLLICLLFATRRAAYRWADARRARHAAFKTEDDDHDDNR